MRITRPDRDDPTYFSELEKVDPRLHRYTLAMTPWPSNARELYSDTVTEGWLGFPRLDKLSEFDMFIFSVAWRLNRNILRDAFTRRRVDLPLEDVSPPEDSPDTSDTSEVIELMMEKFKLLKPAHKHALTLYALQKRSIEDTAEIMGMSVTKVRGKLERGREALRRLMGVPKPTATSKRTRARRTDSHTNDEPSLNLSTE